LKKIYTCVLPICLTCKSQGAKKVFGRYHLNGEALLKRLDNERRMAAATLRVGLQAG